MAKRDGAQQTFRFFAQPRRFAFYLCYFDLPKLLLLIHSCGDC
jgi:hypothetical protein